MKTNKIGLREILDTPHVLDDGLAYFIENPSEFIALIKENIALAKLYANAFTSDTATDMVKNSYKKEYRFFSEMMAIAPTPKKSQEFPDSMSLSDYVHGLATSVEWRKKYFHKITHDQEIVSDDKKTRFKEYVHHYSDKNKTRILMYIINPDDVANRRVLHVDKHCRQYYYDQQQDIADQLLDRLNAVSEICLILLTTLQKAGQGNLLWGEFSEPKKPEENKLLAMLPSFASPPPAPEKPLVKNLFLALIEAAQYELLSLALEMVPAEMAIVELIKSRGTSRDVMQQLIEALPTPAKKETAPAENNNNNNAEKIPESKAEQAFRKIIVKMKMLQQAYTRYKGDGGELGKVLSKDNYRIDLLKLLWQKYPEIKGTLAEEFYNINRKFMRLRFPDFAQHYIDKVGLEVSEDDSPIANAPPFSMILKPEKQRATDTNNNNNNNTDDQTWNFDNQREVELTPIGGPSTTPNNNNAQVGTMVVKPEKSSESPPNFYAPELNVVLQALQQQTQLIQTLTQNVNAVTQELQTVKTELSSVKDELQANKEKQAVLIELTKARFDGITLQQEIVANQHELVATQLEIVGTELSHVKAELQANQQVKKDAQQPIMQAQSSSASSSSIVVAPIINSRPAPQQPLPAEVVTIKRAASCPNFNQAK